MKKELVWTKEKIAQLKNLYPTNDNEFVAKKMNMTVSAIRNAAVKFDVAKSERYWSGDQVKILLKDWDTHTAEEIATKIGRKKWAVINKYRELKGLRKKSVL